MNFRVGIAYDVHQLAAGRKLWLGGVEVEHEKGAVGHSDADVLIHVICDALLGAANLRDIGFHFPDTDTKYKDIDSKVLLQEVMKLLQEHEYAVGNVDTTICLQRPKIQEYIPKMKSTLARVMGVSEDVISIKATTTEKMGFVGREEGISAFATALIYNNPE